nr:acyltransferase family protein [Acetobacter conturbans]
MRPTVASRKGWRPDIDGLRAVAVLSVVLYHVFPALMPGGFVGVDVFFVISGFLITGHLLEHDAKGRVGLLDFYLRRICRLAPALLCVLAAILVAGWFTLLPVEFAELGKDVSGAALSISNLLSWHEQGYFDREAALKPLLHVWSLGVEEQFYLIWPLLLLGICRWHKHRGFLMASVFTVSGVISCFYAFTNPTAGFYSPFSRLWEFLLGGGLVFLQTSDHRRTGLVLSPRSRMMLSWCGSVAFGVALALLRPGRFFPGPLALLPAGATAMLLAAGPDSIVNKELLSRPALRWIGRLSYPLYLWHWPLVSWHHIIYGVGTLRNKAGLSIIAASTVLGWLTSAVAERPFRSQHHRGRKAVSLLVALALMCAAGLLVWQKQGWPGRYEPSAATIDVSRINLAVKQGIFSRTPHMKIRRENGITIAVMGDAGDTVMLTGDSLLFQWGPRVEQLLVEGRLKHTVVFVSGPACSPFFRNDYLPMFNFCTVMPDIQRQVIQQYHVRTLVAGAAWPPILLQHRQDQEAFKEDIVRQIKDFSSLGVRAVWLILPTPMDARFDPAALVQRSLLRTTVNEQAIKSGVPISELRDYSDEMAATLRDIARRSQVGVIDPYADICGSSPSCFILDTDGEPKYADMSHLRPEFVKKHIHFLDSILTSGSERSSGK